MPFEGVLDYASFSIRIPEAEVEQLDALLRAVPAARKVREYVREYVRTRASRPAASALHGPFLPCFLPSLPPCVHPYFLSSLLAYHLRCSPGGDARGDGHPVDTLHLRKVNPAARRMAAQARAAARLPQGAATTTRHYLLLTTCYSLLVTHYLLLTGGDRGVHWCAAVAEGGQLTPLLTAQHALLTTLLVWYYLLTTSRCRRCPHSPTSSRAAPPARRRAHGLRAVGCCMARRWPTRTDQRWLRGCSLFPVRRTPRPTRWTRSSCSLPAGWTCHDRARDQHATTVPIPSSLVILIWFSFAGKKWIATHCCPVVSCLIQI